MNGKLIVLEGLSAAGKHTQCQLLLESLHKDGKKAVLFTFPDYESPVGQLIAEYLAGKWGKKEELVRTAVILYALDRYQNAPRIQKALQENDYVILDRYSPANYAFQGALVKSETEKAKLWKWIDSVEQNLPRADTVIFLDVPRTVTQRNYADRSPKNPLTKKDIHESDAAFEDRVHQNYLQLSQQKQWTVISCTTDGQLELPETIHQKIVQGLRKKKSNKPPF